ncbi:MAG: hypothetical protein ACREMA_21085 [Longimicrobiales bacterium]
MPVYARSAAYWIITALMVLAGGAVSWLYFGDRAEALLAVHVGLSTPLILQKLTTSVAEPAGSRAMLAPTAGSLRDFFTW